MKTFKSVGVVASFFVILVAVIFFFRYAGAEEVVNEEASSGEETKNVIFMIPDGFSAGYATNYRIYKGEETIFDQMLVGMMKTYSEDNWVTDSAAAGTAMATGVKTNNGMISVSSDGEELKTILEAANEAGKSTGLIATSTITHATPAVFASHVESRGSEAEIALQMIEKVDVLLGGGKSNFLPESEGGTQPKQHVVEEAMMKGFQFVETRDELLAIQEDYPKLLGLFAADAMASELERESTTNEPSLAEMTEVAIQTLSKQENGFFLMVEGSQIDWAGHAHDAAWAMTDTEAFEAAIQKAIEFAEQDGNTLVVVAGDHETGGMTVGGYDEYLANVDILHDVSATGNYMASQLNEERSNAHDVLVRYTNIELTKEEEERIMEASDEVLVIVINEIVSERAYVGWSTTAHTGVDVPLYAYGPSSHLFHGVLNNTDIPKRIAKAMKLELNVENH
ncbi:alkaline phosphatase [Alkalihalobacillus alcalophilus ATCC 27647 = CGMCC 1.3604]|uniref:Alkaline phosphatase n=1 Tax=Alkalihalobacillus alcalophilus ATCC 27647 = CGMCC 1.3604 TaxID=1218173 RepID=A0A094YZE2_ALKAL|nr:alkaline phosphatase [Alkalihalobacillus alcalophilus]KGA98932.1 alkaline phosphatase [Alkalihalobacillus alcalophilus ATCC 27647 = CGMCC 1.3604]MED1561965.1 alkaline phosphatase [Alkalihalobacillus alcalophilus]THG90329.1 alkaline phosphatase [Alkalihalobacillus alcalophilus ATCC 27647 = CGMCC 1.3604]